MGVVAAAAVSGGVSACVVAGWSDAPKVEYGEREPDRAPALGTHFAAYEAGQYPDLTYAAENAVKAVVNIEAIQRVEVPQRGQFGYDPFLEFFGFPRERSRSGGEPQYREQRAGGSG
ncbi:MAG: serine protease MucD, partial [Alistipes sp.]|nr:serine protease MucD [Alistipes sp.]